MKVALVMVLLLICWGSGEGFASELDSVDLADDVRHQKQTTRDDTAKPIDRGPYFVGWLSYNETWNKSLKKVRTNTGLYKLTDQYTDSQIHMNASIDPHWDVFATYYDNRDSIAGDQINWFKEAYAVNSGTGNRTTVGNFDMFIGRSYVHSLFSTNMDGVQYEFDQPLRVKLAYGKVKENNNQYTKGASVQYGVGGSSAVALNWVLEDTGRYKNKYQGVEYSKYIDGDLYVEGLFHRRDNFQQCVDEHQHTITYKKINTYQPMTWDVSFRFDKDKTRNFLTTASTKISDGRDYTFEYRKSIASKLYFDYSIDNAWNKTIYASKPAKLSESKSTSGTINYIFTNNPDHSFTAGVGREFDETLANHVTTKNVIVDVLQLVYQGVLSSDTNFSVSRKWTKTSTNISSKTNRYTFLHNRRVGKHSEIRFYVDQVSINNIPVRSIDLTYTLEGVQTISLDVTYHTNESVTGYRKWIAKINCDF